MAIRKYREREGYPVDETVNNRVSKVEGIIEQLDKRLDNIEERLGRIESKLDNKFDGINIKIDGVFKWLIGIMFTTWITTILTILFRK